MLPAAHRRRTAGQELAAELQRLYIAAKSADAQPQYATPTEHDSAGSSPLYAAATGPESAYRSTKPGGRFSPESLQAHRSKIVHVHGASPPYEYNTAAAASVYAVGGVGSGNAQPARSPSPVPSELLSVSACSGHSDASDADAQVEAEAEWVLNATATAEEHVQAAEERRMVKVAAAYAQRREALLSGRHVVTLSEAVALAGLQIQIEFGEYIKPGTFELGMIFPASALATKGVEQLAFEAHAGYHSYTDTQAREEFVRLSRSSPTYGAIMFPVKERIRGKTKASARTLGVSTKSVLVLDQGSNQVLTKCDIETVRKWTAHDSQTVGGKTKGGTLTLFVGDGEHECTTLRFETAKGSTLTRITTVLVMALQARRGSRGSGGVGSSVSLSADSFDDDSSQARSHAATHVSRASQRSARSSGAGSRGGGGSGLAALADSSVLRRRRKAAFGRVTKRASSPSSTTEPQSRRNGNRASRLVSAELAGGRPWSWAGPSSNPEALGRETVPAPGRSARPVSFHGGSSVLTGHHHPGGTAATLSLSPSATMRANSADEVEGTYGITNYSQTVSASPDARYSTAAMWSVVEATRPDAYIAIAKTSASATGAWAAPAPLLDLGRMSAVHRASTPASPPEAAAPASPTALRAETERKLKHAELCREAFGEDFHLEPM